MCIGTEKVKSYDDSLSGFPADFLAWEIYSCCRGDFFFLCGRPVTGSLVRFLFWCYFYYLEFVFLWDLFYIFWFLGEKIKLLFGMSDGVWNRWEFKVRGGDVEKEMELMQCVCKREIHNGN